MPKRNKTGRGGNKSQKELAEEERRRSNGKKSTWADRMSERSSKPSSGDDSDPDRKGFQQSFIRGLARAVTRDMEETLRMAPGGELNEQSIEFVRQSAQAVIQQQCELLYDPRKQIHKDICYRIVNEVI